MTDTTIARLRTVGAGIGVVFLAGVATAGWIRVPSRLQAVEARIDSMTVAYHVIDATLIRLETGQEAIKATLREQLCLDLAARHQRNWQECLLGPVSP